VCVKASASKCSPAASTAQCAFDLLVRAARHLIHCICIFLKELTLLFSQQHLSLPFTCVFYNTVAGLPDALMDAVRARREKEEAQAAYYACLAQVCLKWWGWG
jgi:hypothetical protein